MVGKRPPQYRVDDRRITVKFFIEQGLSVRAIAEKLRCPVSTIQHDCAVINAEKERKLAYQLERQRAREELEEELGRVVEERFSLPLEETRKSFTPISRGPKRGEEQVARRRAVVRELRYRGIKQKDIARMLNAPIRTIQRDYAHLKNRWCERPKAREEAVRERLKCFSDEEVIEAFLGSPERAKELWEKIQAHSGKK